MAKVAALKSKNAERWHHMHIMASHAEETTVAQLTRIVPRQD
jgi:hypothetical protein